VRVELKGEMGDGGGVFVANYLDLITLNYIQFQMFFLNIKSKLSASNRYFRIADFKPRHKEY
jgi:hypothetical protein